jgi:hypothetical protein
LSPSLEKEMTMSELHWTGAALLLSLAVLGSGSLRSRRSNILDWEDFAREHGLDAEPRPASDEPHRLSPVRVDGRERHRELPRRRAS